MKTNSGPMNTLSGLFDFSLFLPPTFTEVYKWNGHDFDEDEYQNLFFYGGDYGYWYDRGDITLTPGIGAFIYNPNGASFPIITVGLVRAQQTFNIASGTNYLSAS